MGDANSGHQLVIHKRSGQAAGLPVTGGQSSKGKHNKRGHRTGMTQPRHQHVDKPQSSQKVTNLNTG